MLESFPEPRNVLVVGASRGIGLGFVRALSSDPRVGRIFCGMRTPERAEAVHALAERDCRVRALRLDVTDEQTIADAAKELDRHAEGLQLVLVTAGVLHDDAMRPERKLEALDPAAAQRSWQVNALGPALVLKHMHSRLGRSGKACFASLSARVGSIGDNRRGGWYAYRSAKAAQNQMVHTAALELARTAPELICVTLHPGTVDTDLSRPFQRGLPSGQLFDVERACRQLLDVVDRLAPSDSGSFVAWDGQPIPW